MEDAKWVEISFIQGRKILWVSSFILWKMHRHSFIQERSILWRFFSLSRKINLYWKDESLIEKRKIYRRLISLVWKNVAASFIIWKKFLSIFFTVYIEKDLHRQLLSLSMVILQLQQQQTNQWILTSVQFNLVLWCFI